MRNFVIPALALAAAAVAMPAAAQSYGHGPSKAASLIVAVATLAFAPVLTTEAVAQSRDQRQQQSEDDRRAPPRVSPDEARRSAGQYGRPIDTQPRRDGNYSVLVASTACRCAADLGPAR